MTGSKRTFKNKNNFIILGIKSLLILNPVAMSSANGLVGTGFASWYQLQLRMGF